MAWASLIACLFGLTNGGCGADLGGGGLVDFPPYVSMERWESIGPTGCKGWLTNTGSHPARDVRVYFHYSTPQGDTVLVLAPTSTTLATYAMVAIFAPAQVTRGELRFPHLNGTSWAGGTAQFTGDPPPQLGFLGFACLLSPDSARVRVKINGGIAYHVRLKIETATGVAEVPAHENLLGRLWNPNRNCPAESGFGCDGWGTFHVQVRDSAGIKLLPRYVSIGWENFAGVADSVMLAEYPQYGFDEYGLAACPY